VASSYDALYPGPLFSGAGVPEVKKKAPGLTVPQVQVLLCHVLPARVCDARAVLDLIAYWQRRNHAAYVSHRKRRIALLSQLE